MNDVKLVVDATETGSFQIVYNLIETVSGGEIGQLVNYLTDTEQKRYILNGILGLGAFFVKLCKAIRGDKVEKEEILDNENVELTVGERKIIATLAEYDLYKNSKKAKHAVENMATPLENEDILTIKKDEFMLLANLTKIKPIEFKEQSLVIKSPVFFEKKAWLDKKYELTKFLKHTLRENI